MIDWKVRTHEERSFFMPDWVQFLLKRCRLIPIFYTIAKKMNDIENTFFISCIHSFQTEEKALLFLLIAMSSVKQSGAFFPSPDSCFAMLRKLQKILTRLFGKPHNNVIASQYKYRTKIHLPIFITRSLWIKHVWLLKYLITIHVFY